MKKEITNNNGKIYLNKNEVNTAKYEDDILPLIELIEFEKYKICKCCGIYYPLHSSFFLNEKRLPDGYENKCRRCRGKQFINQNEGKLKIFTVNENKNVIENYEKYLQSNCNKVNGKFINKNLKEIIDYLIKDMKDEDIYNIRREWVKEKKLYGTSINIYDGSISKMFCELYPDRFFPWLFANAGIGYWDNFENRKYAWHWFISKIIDDKLIYDEYKINTIALCDIMTSYRLGGLYAYYSNAFDLLNEFYPNKFKLYEMNMLNDLTSNLVKDCIRDYIFNDLNLNLSDIKHYISHSELLNFSNPYVSKIVRRGMDELFNGFNDMISYCIPELDIEDYIKYNHKNYYLCNDYKIAKSSEERKLYHILKDNGLNVELCSEYDNRYKFVDSINNSAFYPDMFIYSGNKITVIEYYGYMGNSGTFKEDIGYTDKHDNKVDYYTNRLDKDKYDYVGIYPDDLKKDNCKGLVDKFNMCDISIRV